jgi:gluconokinase
MIVVVMGVSGSGKTSVGRALADALGWPFIDGDDFHPPGNVAKMAAGTPLTDADRWPWLDALATKVAAVLAAGGHAVLACSALRAVYRERIAAGAPHPGDIRFVHLKGDRATIAARLAPRQHRYMPATLLDSQFATLEEPADALVVDIRNTIPEQVAQICAALVSGTTKDAA